MKTQNYIKEFQKAEIQKFIKILFHDDKNSNYFISTLKGKKFKQQRISLSDNDLTNILSKNTYISINGFSGWHRQKNECRQVHSIFFDLDCHKENYSKEDEQTKNRTLLILQDAIEEGFPEPNLIIDSGRGIHLYYIFQDSLSYKTKDGSLNKKSIDYYLAIREQLANDIENLLHNYSNTLAFDKKVSDFSRIARIPGAFNKKSNSYCKIVHANEDYYFFKDFKLKKKSFKTTYVNGKFNKIISKKIQDGLAINLLKTRIDELIKLQRYRNYNCEGCREYMVFLFYNSAIQLHGKKESAYLTSIFNKNFTNPLTDEEIVNTIEGIRTNKAKGYCGYYKITKNWIIKNLSITEEEIKSLGLFKHTSNSREIKKQENIQKKKERNDKVIEMKLAGMKHKNIAYKMGISLRTVQYILKNNS